MTLTFERATPADAETLLPIQIAAFHNDALIYPGVEEGGPPGYDQLEVLLEKINRDIYYKFVYDGQIVGGLVIDDLGHGHLHVDVLYIDPAYHNRGIGTRAMQFIEQEHRAALWTLNTPQYALRNQHFYEKLGYVRVGEGPEPGGILLIDYEKRISVPPP